MSQIDGTRPSSCAAPSIWYEAVAAPQTKPSGKVTPARAGCADVDVTVIDKTNHHLFQPLLYQVATAGLAAPSIAAPVRALFRKQPNITTLLGEVGGIDPATRSVQLANGDRVPYDHLIVAAHELVDVFEARVFAHVDDGEIGRAHV